jgi:DNA-directed RNA polymerase specialized sigma24 family protein
MTDASTNLDGSESEPPSPHLSVEEVVERINALSADDKKKLRLIAERRLAGTDYTAGLLVQESICQALLGERHCPRDTAFVAFLAQSMRSVAYHLRRALRRQVPITQVDGAGNVVELPLRSDGLDPEEALLEAEAGDFVDEMYMLLDGDDEAQLTIIALGEGKKGKPLRDELGVDQAGYDYIMKRIRRTAAKKYPKGWSR